MRGLTAVLLGAALLAAVSGAQAAPRQGLIVFARIGVDKQSTDVWLFGARLRRVTTDFGDDHAPVLSPDRRTILFQRNVRGGRTVDGRLYLVSTRGGLVRPALGGGLIGGNPSWAPGGRRIAYERGRAIEIANLMSRRTRRLLTNGEDPAWSPDGRSIAFVHVVTATIRTIRTDGTGERVLASYESWGYGGVQDLDWSPDGKSLAFAARAPSGEARGTIAMLNVIDGKRRELVIDRDNPVKSPTWSPDGRTVAYAAGLEDPPYPWEPDSHYPEIWTVDVATGRRAVLVRSRPHGVMNLSPDWR